MNVEAKRLNEIIVPYRILIIKNIPDEVTKEQLDDLFSQFNGFMYTFSKKINLIFLAK
jgi:RNA recognition motif-containing protein